MEILGIGPLELLFILLIALIILGPGDMVKAGRTLGRLMRKVVTSSEWHTIQKASRELRYLPNRLMREANMEDLSKELSDLNKLGNQIGADIKKTEADLSSWITPPSPADNQADKPALAESPAPTSDSSDVAVSGDKTI